MSKTDRFKKDAEKVFKGKCYLVNKLTGEKIELNYPDDCAISFDPNEKELVSDDELRARKKNGV